MNLAFDFNDLSMSSADITSAQLIPSLYFGIRLDPPPKVQQMKEGFNLE